MWSILGAIFGSIWGALGNFVTGLMTRQQAQTVGAQKVALATDDQTVKTEAAVAKAEATAPKTQAQAVAAFENDQV